MTIDGYAEFKSHVLRRDEKGIFGIPFKRWLFSGLGGAMVTTFTKIAWPEYSVPMGIVSAILLVFLTAPRGGIPRWQHIAFDLRWTLMAAAAAVTPTSPSGKVGLALGLPTNSLELDGGDLFNPDADTAPRTLLTDWVSFARYDAQDNTEALVFSSTPGLNLSEAA